MIIFERKVIKRWNDINNSEWIYLFIVHIRNDLTSVCPKTYFIFTDKLRNFYSNKNVNI